MAGNPNPAPGKRFVKGVSGNPSGRPKLPEDLRSIKEYDGSEIKRLISKYFRMTQIEVHAALKEITTPMIEINIASGLVFGAKNGDLTKIAFLLDRLIGKVPHDTTVIVRDNPAGGIPTEALLKRLEDGE